MALLGTGITLSGHSAVSQAAVRPCRLQLCAVVGRAQIFLSSPSGPKFMHIYETDSDTNFEHLSSCERTCLLFRKVTLYTMTSYVHCLQCVLGNSIINRGLWLCCPNLNLCSFYPSVLEDKGIVTALTLQII